LRCPKTPELSAQQQTHISSLLSLKGFTTVSILNSSSPKREYSSLAPFTQEDAEAKGAGKMYPDAQIQQEQVLPESENKSKIQVLLSRAQKPEV
jgi:hypothetical protein